MDVVAMVGISLVLGFLCGLVWWDLGHRRAALDTLTVTTDEHKAVTKRLMDLHNKSVSEHAVLLDKVGTLEHMLTNRKTEPLMKKF